MHSISVYNPMFDLRAHDGLNMVCQKQIKWLINFANILMEIIISSKTTLH